MDKQGWQIALSFKLFFIVLGIIRASLPWSTEPFAQVFMQTILSGFTFFVFIFLLIGIANSFHNLWKIFIKKEGGWESVYQPGPEHMLILIYTISLPLIILAGTWVIYPAYFITLLLMLFITGAYMGEEIRKRKEEH